MAVALYVRSSSVDQHSEYQEEQLRRYAAERGLTVDKVFAEKRSGRTLDREQLREMLDWVREGDTVIVQDWSRLSRNGIGDLLKIVDTLSEKGVTLLSTKEGAIDNSATGKLVLEIMASIQNWQIEIQREKQLDGIQKAKEKGVYQRRSAMVDRARWEELRGLYQRRQLSKSKWAKELGVSRPTLDRLIAREDAGENIFRS